MDPVANIVEQRVLARQLVANEGSTPEDAARLAELMLALDEWRERGGFDPYDESQGERNAFERLAWVRNATDRHQLAAYLPDNYEVIVQGVDEDGNDGWLVCGRDVAGWTLDGYVIPRLASGLIWATEIKP